MAPFPALLFSPFSPSTTRHPNGPPPSAPLLLFLIFCRARGCEVDGVLASRDADLLRLFVHAVRLAFFSLASEGGPVVSVYFLRSACLRLRPRVLDVMSSFPDFSHTIVPLEAMVFFIPRCFLVFSIFPAVPLSGVLISNAAFLAGLATFLRVDRGFFLFWIQRDCIPVGQMRHSPFPSSSV